MVYSLARSVEWPIYNAAWAMHDFGIAHRSHILRLILELSNLPRVVDFGVVAQRQVCQTCCAKMRGCQLFVFGGRAA